MTPPDDRKSQGPKSKKVLPKVGLTLAQDNVARTSSGDLDKRMVPRFPLAGTVYRHRFNGKPYDVFDVSVQGIGMRIPQEDTLLFTVGAPIEGSLRLQGETLEVAGKVVFRQGVRAGVEWTRLDSEVERQLNSLLSPESLGRELKAFPFLKPGRAPTPGQGDLPAFVIEKHWFHGASGTDLIVETRVQTSPSAQGTRAVRNEVVEVQIFCLGHYIEWRGKFRTGTVVAAFQDLDHQTSQDLIPLEVRWDEELQSEKLSIAKRLVLSSNLPEWVKALFA